MPRGRLRIATCQFAETWNPARNAEIVRGYIAAAKKRRADVVHFHECCLSGYGRPVGEPGYDWDPLRRAMQSVLAEARRRRIWVVLGSSHRLTPPHKPHNCLYLISPGGSIVDRYDKRFCTNGDLKNYSPGDHFATFRINGVPCSMLICYDVRFPELYRGLYKLGTRVVFHSFHNARREGSGQGIHRVIMRPTLQARAATNAMWISAPNSSARHQCWPSVFVTPDGRIEGQLPTSRAGCMVHTVDLKKPFYDASAAHRDRSIRGTLHSGTAVRDARSTDRKCL